jgi:hypothetical protein
VWKEQKDQILAQGSLLWPRNLLMMVARGERIREGEDEAVSVRAAFKLEERFQGGLGLGNAGRVEEKMLGNTPYADYLVPGTAVLRAGKGKGGRGVRLYFGTYIAALHAFKAID